MFHNALVSFAERWIITMKDMQFHKLLICASSLHCERRRRQFCELNLSDGQPKVLANLLIMEGCIQKELAQRCRVKSATMTSLLQKMERDGLIFKKKEFVSGGKRAYKIFLTEKGREMAEKANRIVERIEEECFFGFSEEEKKKFIELFSRVTKNLDDLEKNMCD